MNDDKLMGVAAALVLLGLVLWSIFLITSAIDCGNKGGAFLVPQNSFPVCVAGVK